MVVASSGKDRIFFFKLKPLAKLAEWTLDGSICALRLSPTADQLAVGFQNGKGHVYDLGGKLSKYAVPARLAESSTCVFLGKDAKPVPQSIRNRSTAEAMDDVAPFTRVRFHLTGVGVEHPGTGKRGWTVFRDKTCVETWLSPGSWVRLVFGSPSLNEAIWPWNGWPEVHLKTKGLCLYLAPDAKGPWTLLAIDARQVEGRKALLKVAPPKDLYGVGIETKLIAPVRKRIQALGVRELSLDGVSRALFEQVSELPELNGLIFTYTTLPPLDLRPLAKLKQLRSVYIEGLSILDPVESIAGLTQLEHLCLNSDRSSNHPPLEYLPLEGLTDLTHLDLSENTSLKRLDFLKGMHHLQYLILRDCPGIEDFSPLSSLTSLLHLEITKNQHLGDLSVIAGSRELAYLNLEECSRAEDNGTLRELRNLLNLNLYRCKGIRNLAPIRKLSRLGALTDERASLEYTFKPARVSLLPSKKTPGPAGKPVISPEQQAELETFLKGLNAVGWFGPLPDEVRGEIDRRAREETLSAGAPWGVLSLMWMDGECVDEEGVYAGLLAELAEASGKTFRPEKISEKWNLKKEQIRLSFKHGRKTFRRVLAYESDWIDPSVFELVNEALAESGTPLRFLPLPGGGQDFSITLTTPALMAAAQKKSLIPREDS
jgi:hypothetical protein